MSVASLMKNDRRAAELRFLALEGCRQQLVSHRDEMTDQAVLVLFGRPDPDGDGYALEEVVGTGSDDDAENICDELAAHLLEQRLQHPEVATPVEALRLSMIAADKLNTGLEVIAVAWVRGARSLDAGYGIESDTRSGFIMTEVGFPDHSMGMFWCKPGVNDVTGEPTMKVEQTAATDRIAFIDHYRVQLTMSSGKKLNDLKVKVADAGMQWGVGEPTDSIVSIIRVLTVLTAKSEWLEMMA